MITDTDQFTKWLQNAIPGNKVEVDPVAAQGTTLGLQVYRCDEAGHICVFHRRNRANEYTVALVVTRISRDTHARLTALKNKPW